jgi:hypothetical protein
MKTSRGLTAAESQWSLPPLHDGSRTQNCRSDHLLSNLTSTEVERLYVPNGLSKLSSFKGVDFLLLQETEQRQKRTGKLLLGPSFCWYLSETCVKLLMQFLN